MKTELQTYTAQLPAVPDVPPTQVEWIAKVRQSPVLRMDDDQATTAQKWEQFIRENTTG